MSYRSGPCTCHSGKVRLLACGVMRDGGRFSEVRETTCDRCGGSGTISPARATAMNAGEAMRRDRVQRGVSQRQEAERLGITPQELSRREQGR